MLTRLTSNQIANHWDEIKEHLNSTLVPFVKVTPMMLNNIFESCIAGRSQVWTVWEWDSDKKVKTYAMVITAIQIDPVSRTKNLLIYSLSGYAFIPENLWQEGIEVIKEYAKKKGCHKILAYSSVDRIITVAKELGGNTDVRYIEWEV